MFKEFLKLTFIPFVVVGLETKKRTNSIIAAVLCGLLSFVFAGISWGIFWTDNTTESSKVLELKNQVAESKIENLELKKELQNFETIKNTSTADKTKSAEKKQKTPEKTAEVKKQKEYTFSSGNYVSGKDFEAGTYDIIAVKGSSGNVISDNMFDGGINAIMGLNSDFAEKEYKNIRLKKGVTLEVKGITIKLVKIE